MHGSGCDSRIEMNNPQSAGSVIALCRLGNGGRPSDEDNGEGEGGGRLAGSFRDKEARAHYAVVKPELS